ncbi:hypothetical protein SDC9_143853 [bioreactor metagenome]|uniref:Uncharacterized protein n=1 Tax=bioreactor metagenome TaxID=1076179 RepID=A0A645E5N3_9ZZZZ
MTAQLRFQPSVVDRIPFVGCKPGGGGEGADRSGDRKLAASRGTVGLGADADQFDDARRPHQCAQDRDGDRARSEHIDFQRQRNGGLFGGNIHKINQIALVVVAWTGFRI